LIIAAIGAPLTKLALLFGPAEYFGLMVLGLGLAIVLARGSVLKAVIMVVLGLLLATVGTDLETGQERLTLGLQDLSDGIDFAVLAMGVFGIAEILRNLEAPEARAVVRGHIGRLLPSKADLRRSFGPIVRATGLGSALGILPGNGAVLAPFASYTLEKKLAKDPRQRQAWQSNKAASTKFRFRTLHCSNARPLATAALIQRSAGPPWPNCERCVMHRPAQIHGVRPPVM